MKEHIKSRIIFILQVASLSWIWIFVLGVSWWIVRLITEAIKLNDAPDASVGISIVVIPIFITLAIILTYVFIGLQLNRKESNLEKNQPTKIDEQTHVKL